MLAFFAKVYLAKVFKMAIRESLSSEIFLKHQFAKVYPVNAFKDQVFHGLDLIDKSFHRGIHKVWILQHLFIPRLRWPLLIYEISISVVLQLDQKISCLLRKWLKLHHSTTNICLYSSISTCHLP